MPGVASASNNSQKTIIGIIGVAAVVVMLALVLTLRSGSFALTTEGKLENAITRGSLIAPSGDSAYDYYNKLKQEGASASKLEPYNQKLLPLLTALPERLMSDLVNKPEQAERPLAEWQDAQRLMTWASEIRPTDKSMAAKAAYCRGRVAYLQERWDDALQAWMQASNADSSWAMPVNGVGLIYNNKKEYSTARQYLQEAIRLAPKWASPYNNMGTSYFMEKNFYEAKPYYERAKELAPQWARPYAWLGDIAYEWADYCQAREMYQAAIERAPAGMSNWNPQRMQRKVEAATAKCSTLSRDTRRIEFGRGDTVATLSGITTSGDNYVIKVMSNQTMTVNLNSADNNAVLKVFNSQMEPLSGNSNDTYWSGTINATADYNILIKPTFGTARYTFTVSIPPLS
jgi:tetratricopeptide (TPR) repeat protein